MLYLCSRIVLTIPALTVALGGLYDVFTPRLPANLAARCHSNENIQIAVRELLRALGACLVAIGATVGILANATPHEHAPGSIALILILVLPSEGANAIGMHRVRLTVCRAPEFHFSGARRWRTWTPRLGNTLKSRSGFPPR